jgi:hypothetical protein
MLTIDYFSELVSFTSWKSTVSRFLWPWHIVTMSYHASIHQLTIPSTSSWYHESFGKIRCEVDDIIFWAHPLSSSSQNDGHVRFWGKWHGDLSISFTHMIFEVSVSVIMIWWKFLAVTVLVHTGLHFVMLGCYFALKTRFTPFSRQNDMMTHYYSSVIHQLSIAHAYSCYGESIMLIWYLPFIISRSWSRICR